MTPTPRAAARRRIVGAARELFRTNGVRAVTMADVAREAGYSRQMVYKVFFDRRELVLAATIERIVEIADAATPGAQVPDAGFTESFVELSVQIIETLRNDPELSALLGDGSPVTPHEALWEPELVERAVRFWQPWLDFGRTRHLLRDDLSNRDLADWLHTVYASIILRRNIPQEDERAMIERFVMTSLAMASVVPR
ncbi:TetR/AcrR family transcriptional regulator [Mycobacterium sp. DL592]|uniref:TetR/AcrR family transcriptional regulator n=1 Tax=Mycobacterium sp. DL592 TaxID=2675524 RepID=UPI0014216835|nr:TetR/AcrR family transcriptional regulator [Mycobacterium sp. DL592]